MDMGMIQTMPVRVSEMQYVPTSAPGLSGPRQVSNGGKHCPCRQGHPCMAGKYYYMMVSGSPRYALRVPGVDRNQARITS